MERFWEKVFKQSIDDCWLWRASKSWDGYGLFFFKGKLRRAHRVSWILFNGKIPQGLFVLHHCDNRSCVNPAHLFLGDQKTNMADMTKKGRRAHIAPKGEQQGNSKLTEKDVILIRTRYARGNVSQRKIAREHGVSKSLIGYIVRGEIWI